MFPLSRACARRARQAADHAHTMDASVDALAEQFASAMLVDGRAEDMSDLLARISIGCADSDAAGPVLYSEFDGAERSITDDVGLSVSTDGLIVARGDLFKQIASGRRVIARVH